MIPPNAALAALFGARTPTSNACAHLGVEAHSKGFYRASTCASAQLRPTWLTEAARRAHLHLLSCARSQHAPPALRPVLSGTRRRKRRRGPFGPEVEKC